MGFRKILVANRGEIACRVLRTARALGYRTVAVYSDADRHARHVALADEALRLGPGEVQHSYLDMDALLVAAQACSAEAIHPGYGFLSENAEFARRCQEAGLVFIGPDIAAIELMGSKRLSKIAMQAAGVPCIPGYEDGAQDDASLIAAAERIGYPLMVKASAGGGGRGMRRIDHAEQLREGLHTARSEAMHAFGSDELILEKAIIRPRHVEIQVFADRHGQVIHLGERDCSIQRRHQKVIEESPCPVMTEDLRQAMGEAAILAARSCHYVGAGTVEFLLAPEGNFYFLEMNTRLQVEHPVTEMVTGLDLVAWQIRVAAGHPLPLRQEQIKLQGHAIEVRFYAEDPTQGFLPQTGPVLHWHGPEDEGVRVDHGLLEGGEVSPFYDPMLAKIIAWGQDREEACRRLWRAVEDTRLLGVPHNQRFLIDLLQHPAFLSGATHTAFIEDHLQHAESLSRPLPTALDVAVAALLMNAPTKTGMVASWRARLGVPALQRLRHDDKIYAVELRSQQRASYHLSVDGESFDLELQSRQDRHCEVVVAGRRHRYTYVRTAASLYLQGTGAALTFSVLSDERQEREEAGGSGLLQAPMDGAIRAILLNPGDRVTRGQTILLLEAMKMEHPIKASCDGILERVEVQLQQQVKKRQLLAVITPETTS